MVKKNWRKRKFLIKRKNTYKLLFLLVLGMSVGFAAIATTLNFTGTVNVAKTTWDIHWENPTKVGGVTATKDAALKENDNTIVEYQVSLQDPGDYYEFTVNAVNSGTIDAMITGISNKVYDTNNVEQTQPDYIEFKVTYADGVAIEDNHYLKVNKSETYKVKVAYKTGLAADQFPTAETTYKFVFQVTYAQADEASAIDKPEPVTPDYYDFGDPTTSSPTSYESLEKKVFVKLDSSGNKSVCLVKNNVPECFKPEYTTEEQNHAQGVLTDVTCAESVKKGVTRYICSGSSTGYSIMLTDNGLAYISESSTGEECSVYSDGTVECEIEE